MASQNGFNYMPQGSEPRYIPGQDTSWPTQPRMIPRGGTDMLVTLSNQSTDSTRSRYSDATDLSFASSATTMSSRGEQSPVFDFDRGSPAYLPAFSSPTSFNPGSFGTSPGSYGRSGQRRRETPSSLGWGSSSILQTLYNFVVVKGKEPYFELQSNYRVTYEMPERVYLDAPLHAEKGLYPCQFPGCSTSKPFNRPADRERHYKNVHASEDQKDRYECDYSRCDRSTDPFTRKDHYRDHLRDYHKEDLGQAKRGKKEDRQKWEKAQEAWLAERNISPNWWRCAKCLTRVHVDDGGWECRQCNTACEQERRASRRAKKEGSPATFAYEPAAANCSTCAGSAWIDSGIGGWAACPNCNPTTGPQEPSFYTEPWDGDDYHIRYSSY